MHQVCYERVVPLSRRAVCASLALILLAFAVSSSPPSHSASQSLGKNIIVQHEYVIPTGGFSEFNVSLTRVTSGNLLVVGVVFGSMDTGTVADTLSNNFTGQIQPSQPCYPCAPNLATGIWWSVSKSSGNDTVVIRSSNSTELVEVFEIAGTNSSTIGYGGGGGWSPNPGINTLTAAQDIHDGNAFVLLIGGDVNGSGTSETCYPYGPIDNSPAQSPGFIIEPYCGAKSPFTSGLIFGEYGVGNNTGQTICQPKGNGTSCSITGKGFTADLGANPPLAGNVLGQVFYIDPVYSAATQLTTTGVVSTHPFGNSAPGKLSGWALYVAIGVAAAVVTVGTTMVLLRRRSRSLSTPFI